MILECAESVDEGKLRIAAHARAHTHKYSQTEYGFNDFQLGDKIIWLSTIEKHLDRFNVSQVSRPNTITSHVIFFSRFFHAVQMTISIQIIM